MNTVKIYKVTCTKGATIAEQGTGFSLRPWGNNTDRIEGHDDGGTLYVLPDKFEVSETADGRAAIFRGAEYCEILMHSSGRPQIITRTECPVLSPA